MSVLRWLFLVMMIVLVAASAFAEAPQKPGDVDRAGPRQRPMLIDNDTWIDANNINMVVTNHGSFAYDLTTQDPGLEFPKGTDKQCVYAGGIWIGCKVLGAVRVTAGSFTQEYTPGPIHPDGSWNDRGYFLRSRRRPIFSFHQPPGNPHTTIQAMWILYQVKHRYPERFGLK